MLRCKARRGRNEKVEQYQTVVKSEGAKKKARKKERKKREKRRKIDCKQ